MAVADDRSQMLVEEFEEIAAAADGLGVRLELLRLPEPVGIVLETEPLSQWTR
ncbi:hypothetical protein K7472_28915 [Streptomyces sp. PTM05]|uniref:Uncharacterized protein n=1 Tax=Streptantibioticus parmotrematis TaxID=2873249 RepID=A0ABS7R035_9ACTN|nr:hypothetical protein [Streptantibioticus parmotrematis]MBY8888836.1 hypothetical protein [Streptantibioticus parmotrematis]